ncbi:Uncharacterised protein [Vibrio cholerae]|nr:Uncharacterised protein [Vibrio cholerae]CSC02390.1 Uncharacterised protein [Vibrio cholerae]
MFHVMALYLLQFGSPEHASLNPPYRYQAEHSLCVSGHGYEDPQDLC